MKFSSSSDVAVVENDSPIQSFQMEASAKSFGIIVDGIYSNKIEAIVREYSCNAVDSHKEDGHSKPFDIHLPVYSEPTFSIRDYGVGLDEHDIVTVYTVAFASTKENTNLVTGMLGIGGMSGFCYNTKSFTVTSWKNGKKLIYHCFIGNGGVPAYTKLLEEDSDEPNGVKVEIPVKTHDFYAFEQACDKLFKWFDIKPNYVNSNKTVGIVNKELVTGDYYIVPEIGTSHVLMGNVLYPVRVDDVELEKYKHLINAPILIEAPIGAVDFASSRENLQYNSKTVAFLKGAYAKIILALRTEIENKISSANSWWKARKELQKIRRSFNKNILIVLDSFIKSVSYNGEELTTDIDIDSFRGKYRYFEYYPSLKTGCKEKTIYKIHHTANIDIYFNDGTCSGPISRTKKGVADFGTSGLLFQDVSVEEVKRLFKCSDEDIILVDTIEKPEVNRGATRDKLSTIMRWVYSYSATGSWVKPNDNELDDEESKFYVIRKAYNVIRHDGREIKAKDLDNDIGIVKNELGRDINVYSVTKTNVKNIPDDWIEFTEYSKEIIDGKRDECQEFINIEHKYNEINYFKSNNEDYLYSIRNCPELKDHPLGKMVKEIDEHQKNVKKEFSKYDSVLMRKLSSILNIDVTKTYSTSSYRDILLRYNLLAKYFDSSAKYYYKMSEKDMFHYIKGVDNE